MLSCDYKNGINNTFPHENKNKSLNSESEINLPRPNLLRNNSERVKIEKSSNDSKNSKLNMSKPLSNRELRLRKQLIEEIINHTPGDPPIGFPRRNLPKIQPTYVRKFDGVLSQKTSKSSKDINLRNKLNVESNNFKRQNNIHSFDRNQPICKNDNPENNRKSSPKNSDSEDGLEKVTFL